MFELAVWNETPANKGDQFLLITAYTARTSTFSIDCIFWPTGLHPSQTKQNVICGCVSHTILYKAIYLGVLFFCFKLVSHIMRHIYSEYGIEQLWPDHRNFNVLNYPGTSQNCHKGTNPIIHIRVTIWGDPYCLISEREVWLKRLQLRKSWHKTSRIITWRRCIWFGNNIC